MAIAAPPAVTRWAPIAQQASKQFGVPTSLLLAQINQESGGHPVASTGSTPGQGNLTQFLPGTAPSYGVKFGTSPQALRSQIFGQAKFLSELGAGQNPRLALAKYNAGPGNPGAGMGYAQSVLAQEPAYRSFNHVQAGLPTAGPTQVQPAQSGPVQVPGAAPKVGNTARVPVPQVNPALASQVQRGRMVEQLLSRTGSNLPNANLLLGAVQGQVQNAQQQINSVHHQQIIATAQNKANAQAATGPLVPTKAAAHGMNAHRDLQELAGPATVNYHPTTGAGTVGTAGNKLSEMTKFADAQVGKPYIWGGGHSNFDPKQPGFDCSGFVSAVLHSGGFLSAPQSTQTLPGQPGIADGPGRFVTVYDRTDGGTPENDHVILNLNGAWYEAGGNSAFNSSGGVSKISKPPQSYLDSFNRTLHPLGL